MSYYIDKLGNYYEGDRIDSTDYECSKQPSSYHIFDMNTKKWLIDNNKIKELKMRKSAELNSGYNSYITMNVLSDDDRARIDTIYNSSIQSLLNSNDPATIEKIGLNF